jgi:hypothetical protein
LYGIKPPTLKSLGGGCRYSRTALYAFHTSGIGTARSSKEKTPSQYPPNSRLERDNGELKEEKEEKKKRRGEEGSLKEERVRKVVWARVIIRLKELSLDRF